MERTRNPARRAQYEAELAVPDMPMALAYLWRAYHRIRHRKASNGFGPVPIEWPDIDAFVRNSRFVLRPWEIEVIEMIDDLYMVEQVRQSRQKSESR